MHNLDTMADRINPLKGVMDPLTETETGSATDAGSDQDCSAKPCCWNVSVYILGNVQKEVLNMVTQSKSTLDKSPESLPVSFSVSLAPVAIVVTPIVQNPVSVVIPVCVPLQNPAPVSSDDHL